MAFLKFLNLKTVLVQIVLANNIIFFEKLIMIFLLNNFNMFGIY